MCLGVEIRYFFIVGGFGLRVLIVVGRSFLSGEGGGVFKGIRWVFLYFYVNLG